MNASTNISTNDDMDVRLTQGDETTNVSSRGFTYTHDSETSVGLDYLRGISKKGGISTFSQNLSISFGGKKRFGVEKKSLQGRCMLNMKELAALTAEGNKCDDFLSVNRKRVRRVMRAFDKRNMR